MDNRNDLWRHVDANKERLIALSDRVWGMPEVCYTEKRSVAEHIAELNKRASESELRLKRLYDAIEAGVADIDDPALKDRIDGLKAIRDQAKADAERAQAMLDNSGATT